MKKIVLIVMIMSILFIPVSADSNNTNIYFEEIKSEKIIDQLYENKNVKTYKFIIENTIEDSRINVTYYIDNEIIKTDNSVVVFQEETSYFFIGTTLKCIILRPEKNIKSNKYGKTDISQIDEKFTEALQNVKYIRKEKSTIMNNDLIMQFEYSVNNHNYRIDFNYEV